MAIAGSWDVTRPNAKNGGSDPLELVIEEFTGLVEGTIERRSVTESWIPVRSVKGTATVSNFAVGEAKLGKVTPGEAPAADKAQFSKLSLTVDTVIYARNALPLLDVFQTQFDARKEIANEHGKKIAKFKDQSFFIQAAKAAQLTESPFGATEGHGTGNVVTLTDAADRKDPAKLYRAYADLFTKFEEQDVDPLMDDLVIFASPAEYYTLLQSEQLTNGEYITAEGNKIETRVLSAFGVPVINTNNIPQEVISDHELGTAFDGDFDKVVSLVFAPRALLAGETIPLESDVFYDKIYKSWFVDSHLSYSVTPNRPEYAGVILTP